MTFPASIRDVDRDKVYTEVRSVASVELNSGKILISYRLAKNASKVGATGALLMARCTSRTVILQCVTDRRVTVTRLSYEDICMFSVIGPTSRISHRHAGE